ncbi:hypothetical protein F5X96DRAFT_644423 [Biscogniauxia mediterranea]|nr:hypothetical protein F5X96DRAFT_644423 [Biscogniauxia mediterranea]
MKATGCLTLPPLISVTASCPLSFLSPCCGGCPFSAGSPRRTLWKRMTMEESHMRQACLQDRNENVKLYCYITPVLLCCAVRLASLATRKHKRRSRTYIDYRLAGGNTHTYGKEGSCEASGLYMDRRGLISS